MRKPPPTAIEPAMGSRLYRILDRADWSAWQADGVYAGAALDLADGFVHMSYAGQVGGTLARHFAGQDGLLLAVLDADRLDPARLRDEAGPGGQMFPHYYGSLPIGAVRQVFELPLGPAGSHVLPPEIADARPL